MPLTKEQFQAARGSGLSLEKIVEFEKRRMSEGAVDQPKPSLTMRDVGQIALKNLKAAPRRVYQENIAPFVHGASTLALGIPKAVARETGAEEIIYPEQETFSGKAQRFGWEAAGWTLGGAVQGGKFLLNTTLKAVPRLAGKGTLKAAARAAITGAGIGALQTPEAGKGVLKPRERLEQAKTFGAVGAALPFVDAGGRVIGGILTKSGRWVAKNIGGITNATVDTIKRLGADRVFEPAKAKADYITQNLMPRVYKSFQDQVAKFTPSIQKFAEEKLRIPKNVVGVIKRRGVENVNQIRRMYNDSTDQIYQGIKQGFVKKKQFADAAYKKATDEFKGQVDSSLFYRKTQSVLRKKGWVGLEGNPTTRYKSDLDPVLDDIANMYFDMKGTVTRKGKQIIGKKIAKEDFSLYRDKLGRLLRGRPSDRDVMEIRGALYSSAEKSGMVGIKNARNLEAQAFRAERDLLKNSLIAEKKLDKFSKFTAEEVRHLRKIESYTGEKFVDDLEAITSARHLDKFYTYNPNKIATDLINAKDPQWTKETLNRYEELLGRKEAEPLMDDLMAHFANIDFELVTETPGAGGGFAPHRAQLLKRAVTGAAKKYYRDVVPQVQRAKSFLTPRNPIARPKP